MALGHGPTVVTNGLVLALDAADINSFDKNENLRTNSNTGGFFPVVGTWTSTATSTDISAPNGSSTTYKVVSAGGGQASIDIAYQQITLTAGVTYTVSAHFYATGSTTTSRTIGIAIFGNGLSGTGPIVLPQNEWVRRSFTFTATTTSNTGQIRIIDNDTSGFNTTNGAVIYLWGAQLETGSTVSSYYPTTGTAKNRGTTWTDLSGIGNNGTLTAGQTYNSGNSGSINFNGANNQIVSVGTANQYFYGGNLNITFEAWVKSAGLAAGKTVNGIFSFSYGNLLYMNSDGSISFGIWNQAANNWGYLATTSGLNLLDNKWHQVVGTMSATTGAIYTDGVLRTSGSGTHTGTNVWIGMGAQIGNNQNDAYYHFNGSIAIAKFYRSALTAAEVQQNFNALRGRFGV